MSTAYYLRLSQGGLWLTFNNIKIDIDGKFSYFADHTVYKLDTHDLKTRTLSHPKFEINGICSFYSCGTKQNSAIWIYTSDVSPRSRVQCTRLQTSRNVFSSWDSIKQLAARSSSLFTYSLVPEEARRAQARCSTKIQRDLRGHLHNWWRN